jgi:acetoin utilization deacetylase AcuC-like enzyme
VHHNVFFNDDYVASEYSFDTTRKSGDIAESLSGATHVTLVDPRFALERTEGLLDVVHDAEYRAAVASGEPMDLAESQGFPWDENIPVMATAHSSGLVAAVEDVLENGSQVAGSLSSGLHHARFERGEGYCTFNGLAVAATRATQIGATQILVLDFDAHGGGGTRSILDPNVVTQIDVSTSSFDAWTPNASTGDAYLFADKSNYLEAIGEALTFAAERPWDLVLYNAGMDPVNTGISQEALAEREQMVVEWAAATGSRIVYTLAGGYTWGGLTETELVNLHRLTIDMFGHA